MDGFASEMGRAACDVASVLAFAVVRTRCSDLTSIRLMGYGVFGMFIFAASYLTMLRRAPV
jgi:hypothetical protein